MRRLKRAEEQGARCARKGRPRSVSGEFFSCRGEPTSSNDGSSAGDHRGARRRSAARGGSLQMWWLVSGGREATPDPVSWIHELGCNPLHHFKCSLLHPRKCNPLHPTDVASNP